MRNDRLPAVLATALFALLVAVPCTAPPVAADEPAAAEAAEPALSLDAVEIEPTEPGPDTLCRLRVTVRNRGGEIASHFGFDVRINGRPVPVYENHLFLEPVLPGEATPIQLYNFWTTETGRPLPADGRLAVEVSLTEAAWVSRRVEDGVEIWEPLGAVEGLPAAARLSVPLEGAGEDEGGS